MWYRVCECVCVCLWQRQREKCWSVRRFSELLSVSTLVLYYDSAVSHGWQLAMILPHSNHHTLYSSLFLASRENKYPSISKRLPTIWFSNSTPGYIPEENENTNLKRYMYPHIHSSIIYNNQDMEGTQVSINRWMNKEDVIYIYTYNSAMKKNEILPFATMLMNLESIMLSEINQRQILYVITYLESKK